ncbi:unnamed protein product [Acanthoscelides obtectus]|uniref:Uncharacterized protein n=1 Tax=Acanthoscelides obtectus TaxID=200917 RepID=A0A9P0M2L4_ACAOB|nr:unnamed protein product [Acanthoscelides obtectus]CAK1624307.1 hypothetical protein AOBTE_LOCUS2482 [Acanthoscelides obtectus]
MPTRLLENSRSYSHFILQCVGWLLLWFRVSFFSPPISFPQVTPVSGCVGMCIYFCSFICAFISGLMKPTCRNTYRSGYLSYFLLEFTFRLFEDFAHYFPTCYILFSA